ncbi:hypothetical protein A3K80_05270 [Candidatus Bathyarchaeota archaeon RBG_13_38_9]|nr:MAG: hypothetical protein A3K80_05270 [Candidatus Bathyarchaeota archaeon RBG_13_38_9]
MRHNICIIWLCIFLISHFTFAQINGINLDLVNADDSSDSSKIVFSSNRNGMAKIFIINSDGSGETQLTYGEEEHNYPALSPDGSKIAFAREIYGDYSLYVMNVDGSDLLQLTSHPDEKATDLRPAWSPDGKKIAFLRNQDTENNFMVMNADGSGITRLTNVDMLVGNKPDWSPDGSKIVFSSFEDSDNIHVMNADGSGLKRISSDPGNESYPAWSPDGSKITFASDRDGDYEIFVMNVDGSGITQLTYNNERDDYPDWSPDGARIAFYSNRDGNPEIYIMNADGSGQTRLTNNPAVDAYPNWGRSLSKNYSIIIESQETMGESSNQGTITFEGSTYSFPIEIVKGSGNYQITYNPPKSYDFIRWVGSNGITLQDETAQSTKITIWDNYPTYTLKAIYSIQNELPEAYIDSISPNPSIKGQTIVFSGHGIDPDGEITTHEWLSNIDGKLGTLSSFNKSDLSVGTHMISYKVQDNSSSWSNVVTRELVINAAENMTITYVNPKNETEITSSTIELKVRVTSENIPVEDAKVIFYVDDHQIGSDTSNFNGYASVDYDLTLKKTFIWHVIAQKSGYEQTDYTNQYFTYSSTFTTEEQQLTTSTSIPEKETSNDKSPTIPKTTNDKGDEDKTGTPFGSYTATLAVLTGIFSFLAALLGFHSKIHEFLKKGK